jgi:hypothetical protein
MFLTKFVEKCLRQSLQRNVWDEVCREIFETFFREIFGTKFAEKCLRQSLQRNIWDKVCREKFETKFVDKCLRQSLWRNVWDEVCGDTFETKFIEKFKTHILYLITFSRKIVRFWDNVGKYGRDKQATDIILCMPTVCWMSRTTDTHSEYVISLALARQQLLRESMLMLTLYGICTLPVFSFSSAFNMAFACVGCTKYSQPSFSPRAADFCSWPGDV